MTCWRCCWPSSGRGWLDAVPNAVRAADRLVGRRFAAAEQVLAERLSYVIKCPNVGWLRNIVDMRLSAAVIVKNAIPAAPTVLRINLEMSVNEAAALKPGGTRIATFNTEQLPLFMCRRLTDVGLGDIVKKQERSLRGLLELTDD